MLAYMDEVCELKKSRKRGWEERPVKEQYPACLASRHTIRLLQLGS